MSAGRRAFPATVSLALALLLFHPFAAIAAELRLATWRPSGASTTLVLPVEAGTAPAKAAERYLDAIRRAPELAKLIPSAWVSEPGGTHAILPETGGGAPRFALVDNSLGARRAEVRAFEKAGAEVDVVPLGAELAVAENDRPAFRRLVARRFDALVPLGGDDVAPELYGEPVTFARDTNAFRDAMEIALIREYLDAGTGHLFGLCRGQQITAVALGYKLFQDIAHELGISGHESGWHPIDVVAGTALFRFLGGTSSVRVNSFHHQAVRLDSRPGGPLRLAASAGKVVEALETADARVVTVQFHPEAMGNATGASILGGMVALAGRLGDGARAQFAGPLEDSSSVENISRR